MMRVPTKLLLALCAALVFLAIPMTASAAPKSVTVWYSWERPFIRDMIKRYNQTHKNVEIKMQVSGDFDKFMTSAAAGSPPDALCQFDDVVYEWASKGLLLSLDQMIKQRRINLADYSDASIKDVSYKGKVYGIPVNWDPDHVLYMNKQRFSEAGLDWSKPPVYTDEFENCAAKLSTMDGTGKYSKLGWVPWNSWGFYQTYWMGAFGGSVWDEDAMKVTINSAKNVKALDWIGKYTEKYTYKALMSAAGDFILGKAGMMTDGIWMLYRFPKKMDYAIAKVPYPRDGGKQFLPCSGWSYMIPKGAKNVKEAQDFIMWMSEPKQAADFCKDISWLPASMKSRQLPIISDDPALKWFVKVTAGKEDAIWMDPGPVCRTIFNELMNASNLVVQGKKSAKDALDAAQRVAEVDLKRALQRIRVK